MPTGYTASIEKGISFKDFAINCSRAFGSYIMYRDTNPEDIPDEIPVSPYHLGEIKRLEKEKSEIENQSPEGLETKMKKEFNDEKTRIEEAIKKCAILKGKYNAMLAKVEKWIPPTTEHEGLKKFMSEQIYRSVGFDCRNNYYIEELSKLHIEDVEPYKKRILAKITKDIQYHKDEHQKEEVSITQANNWIKALEESLKE